MDRKKLVRVGIAAAVLSGLIIGFKAFTAPGAPGGMPEHITIAQARAGSEGQSVKVGGDVVPGSVGWNDGSQSLTFTLSNEEDSLQVVYPGPAPKDFKPGMLMVVEGTYTPEGIFKAVSITSRSSPLCKTCHQ